ncbi:MAG: tRNA pseudouridine(55) synthase TruB [Acidobacteria bacterium]|nr:tRNA pseudouridine(55) synthase TruB [Acidobacteriota bacterium]
MDGLLIVDKPEGPTSHDIVVRIRRALGERRIGHTGTLDPMASGVLALLLGRATRLARFLAADEKTYEAEIRLGRATDTYDMKGSPLGPPHEGPLPDRTSVDRALDPFRGAFLQQPPPYSAKRIDGTRSYTLARRTAAPPMPAPAPVAARRIDLLELDADLLRLRIVCSAGFYVRSLAHDLGASLGTGAHLARLRRTAAGGFALDDAVTADAVERDPRRAAQRIIPPAGMLPGLTAARLNEGGEHRVAHGRDLGPGDLLERLAGQPTSGVKLLDRQGRLVAIAEARTGSGLLHPSVVLM